MCGIAGIFRNAKVERYEIEQMLSKIQHRGPDFQNYQFLHENLVLGHSRLSILDLSEEANQPMNFGHLTITFNGEIYNYLEIKNELQKKGYQFQTQSDTEVILAAYDCFGTDCLQHFDGMFAFVIYDSKRELLFGARDRFGEKPFYYFWDNRQFVFSSSIHAILTICESSINRKSFYQFLAFQATSEAETTFFDTIFQVPKSSWLIIDKNFQKKSGIYWKLSITSKFLQITTEDAIAYFRDLFQDSVKKRMRSDVEIGTSLSGGLDSSSIVSTIMNFQKKVKTFTARFDDSEKDEGKYVKILQDKFHFQNFEVHPTAQGFYEETEKLIEYQEEPFYTPSSYAQWKVFEMAHQNGLKVLLDGQGADEFLGGYDWFPVWLKQLKLANDIRFQQVLKERQKIQPNFQWTLKNQLEIFFWKIMHKFPKLKDMTFQTSWFRKLHPHYRQSSPFLDADFLQEFENDFPESALSPFLNEHLRFATTKRGLETLLRFADRSSMAFGLEVRLPFLSHHLVDFTLNLPEDFIYREGFTKWILRKSVENQMPKSLVWRKDKLGFAPPEVKWLQHPPLKSLMMHGIGILEKFHFMRKNHKKLLQKFENQPHSQTAYLIWRFGLAGLWYEKFF